MFVSNGSEFTELLQEKLLSPCIAFGWSFEFLWVSVSFSKNYESER